MSNEFKREPWHLWAVKALVRAERRLQKGAYTTGSMVAIFNIDLSWFVALKQFYGAWTFPGGFKNRNELPATGLMRELREELGVNEWHRQPTPVTYRFQEQLRHIDFLNFLVATGHIDLRPSSWEITDARWIPVDDAHKYLNADGVEMLHICRDAAKSSEV